MTPIDQTRFSTPDGSVKGNCFLACIASLFDLSIEDVPELEQEAIAQNSSWPIVLDNWCRTFGYEFCGCAYLFTGMNEQQFWDSLEPFSHDGYFIVGGASPRTYVTVGHSVIFRDRMMVHDPHPSRDGLLSIREVYIFLPVDSPLLKEL